MTATVRLSARSARIALRVLEDGKCGLVEEAKVAAELRAALRPSPKRIASRKASKAKRETRAKTKRDESAGIRALCMLRAAGRCEHCGYVAPDWEPLELDHFFGRARVESVETCWMLCRGCHRRKTNNDPVPSVWLELFAFHAEKHGYSDAARRARDRLAFVETRRLLR
jgi:5-methylcytosine-specific restriction endonuclease McrA